VENKIILSFLFSIFFTIQALASSPFARCGNHEDKNRFKNIQVNLIFRSVCITFSPALQA